MASLQEGGAVKLAIPSQFDPDDSEDAWNVRMKRTVAELQKKLRIASNFGNIKTRVKTLSLGQRNVTAGVKKGKDKLLGPVMRLRPRQSSLGTMSVEAVPSASSSQSSASKEEVFSKLSPTYMPPAMRCCDPQSPSTPGSPTASSTYSPTPPPIPERSHLRPVLTGYTVPKVEPVVEQRIQSIFEDRNASEAWAVDYLELLGIHPELVEQHENRGENGQLEIPLFDVASSERDSAVSGMNGSGGLSLRSKSDLEPAQRPRGPFGIAEGPQVGGMHSNCSDNITPTINLGHEVNTQRLVDGRHESPPAQAHCTNWSWLPNVILKKATATVHPQAGLRKNEKPGRTEILRLRRVVRQYKFQSPIRRVREEQEAPKDAWGGGETLSMHAKSEVEGFGSNGSIPANDEVEGRNLASLKVGADGQRRWTEIGYSYLTLLSEMRYSVEWHRKM